MAVKPPTYRALLEVALRAEETLVERARLKQKRRNFQVASVLHLNPEVLLLLEVLNFNKVGLEVDFGEEEIVNQEDLERFPLVEVDMVLGEDSEAIL